MVTRKRVTAAAVGLSVGLLAQHAAGAEAEVAREMPKAEEFVVDVPLFRSEIDGYVRELNRQMREALTEELRRELAPKVILASDELRTRS